MDHDKRKHKAVYTIVQRDRDGRKFWLRIGAAFPNQDGSLNVVLDAVPTNGQLHIREQRAADARPDSGRLEATDAALAAAFAS